MPGTGSRPGDYPDYVAAVEDRLVELGYRRCEGSVASDEGSVYRRRTFEVTGMGLVDYFVVVTHLDPVDPDRMEAFCEAAFRFGLDNRHLPRGPGSGLVVYPVAAGTGVDADLGEWLCHYDPQHWASIEVPVVADLSSGEVVYDYQRPTWGRYYDGFRDPIESALVPEGWETRYATPGTVPDPPES